MLELKCFLPIFLIAVFSHAQTEIYVSDAGNWSSPPWQILKFDADGSNGKVFIRTNLAWPQDIVFLEDREEVLISNLNSGIIGRYHSETGAYIDDFATGISGPTRMKIGKDELLYVLQWTGNGKVLRYTLDGEFVDSYSNAGFKQAIGFDWDINGNMYISSHTNKAVSKIDSTGAYAGQVIGSNLFGPTNLFVDEEGNLVVFDFAGKAIKRFDNRGNFLDVFIPNITRAEGVAITEDGHYLIGSGGDATVKMYTKEGEYVKNIVSPGTLGLLNPNAVVIRKRRTVSVDKKKVEQVQMTNTSGRMFFELNNQWSQEIISYQVYNSKGQCMITNRAGKALVWDARNDTPGMYILRANLTDHRSLVQKILVR